MKKIIAIALTALMLAAMLCGCTANTTKGKLVLGTSADSMSEAFLIPFSL